MFRWTSIVVLLAVVSGTGCGRSDSADATKSAEPDRDSAAPAIVVHPVFQTQISGRSSARPAIQVDIKDASEDFFFTAELYLAVQTSRFPSETWVLLPLNIGDFAGAQTRFVQLPFEVSEGDTLLFNLLDNDEINEELEELVLEGCAASGYCLLVAGKIYAPPVANILEPAVPIAARILGTSILHDVGLHNFENFGTAEFIVPNHLPSQPHQANELSIRNSSNYVPVVLKIYGPRESIVFSTEPAA